MASRSKLRGARGSVHRHGNGWRGRWWEDGRQRVTRTVEDKDEAAELLAAELHRVRNPGEHAQRVRESLTFSQLQERFLAAHYTPNPTTKAKLRSNLSRAAGAFGEVRAGDVTGERIGLYLADAAKTANYRSTLPKALRQAYKFGVSEGLVDRNPALAVPASKPRRTDALNPFENWAEVEAVAEEAGRWGPLILFAADTGARPGELVALEHKHVEGSRVYLPGQKSDRARRIVHLTERGQAAYAAMPRALSTPLVWHHDGQPLHWGNWRRRVWIPALDLAGLAKRSPYQLRHSFAYWSLRAGVPISDLAVEMGHTNVALTFQAYGHWSDSMGARAASLRAQWDRSVTTKAANPLPKP
jgi:integrase